MNGQASARQRHDLARWWSNTGRTGRVVWLCITSAAVGVIVGLIVLWPSSTTVQDPALVGGARPVPARVVSATVMPCSTSTPADPQDCVVSKLRIAGTTTTGDVPRGEGAGSGVAPLLEQPFVAKSARLHAGDDIEVVGDRLPDGTIQYSFYDYRRGGSLVVLLVVFAIVVVLIGRWRGIGALAGMAVGLAVLVVFLLPALLEGRDPISVAVVGAAAIAFVALFLAQGIRLATAVALLGTLASLAITLALSWIFVRAANLTGLADENASFLGALGGRIDVRGILLAGFVIGSLGVLDDITVTQVSAVTELRTAQPDIASRALFRAAMNIGRDHIASTVNTLVLAYAGAALPLLILFTGARQPITSIAGREVVATEIVRSLVGSIGLVAAVPITTWLAVRVGQPNEHPA